jgi:glucokinase
MNRSVQAIRVLAGDIGGTHTRLCLATLTPGQPPVRRVHRYASGAYHDVHTVLREFLRDEAVASIDAACLAVAGPVQVAPRGQRVAVTNLPWVIDGALLATSLGLRRLRVINDFAAIGHGIGALPASAFAVLQEGAPGAQGTRAVLGAGTGLGQAILVPGPQGIQVLATEGGHVDFGPTRELELDLARWLIHRHGRASYELILSGAGLARLYEFLRESQVAVESSAMRQALERDDPAAVIARAGQAGTDPLAVAAVDLFVRIYGAQAGNLALAAGATGGVFLAGGMAPKMVDSLRDGRFIDAFRNKGSMTELAASIPVRVVVDPDVGLLGAELVAQDMMHAESR